MRILWQQATFEQVKAFALIQNIPHDGRTSENTLRARIEAAMGEAPEEIELPDAGPSPAAVPLAGLVPGKRIIADEENARFADVQISAIGGDKDHVLLAPEGRMMRVPRGRRVTIPIEHYRALNDAVQDLYAEYSGVIDPTQESQGLGEPSQSHSYPFTVFGFYA